MKNLFFLLLTCLLATGLQAQTVIQDKNVQVRSIGSFKALKVSNGITVYLSKGNENSVAVSASETRFRDNIKTEVKNNTLEISYSGSGSFMNSNPKLRVYISYTELYSIEGSGATDIRFQDIFKGTDCRIVMSGASELKGKVELNSLKVTISGASTVNLDGVVKNLELKATGASDFKCPNLMTTIAVAELSGASDGNLTVKEELEARASGASTLKYRGNPYKVKESASGAGSIKRVDR